MFKPEANLLLILTAFLQAALLLLSHLGTGYKLMYDFNKTLQQILNKSDLTRRNSFCYFLLQPEGACKLYRPLLFFAELLLLLPPLVSFLEKTS